MLRTNLSTRPFYNERTVHVVLGVAAIVVIAVTVFDVTRIVALSQRHTESTLRAERDEAAARDVGSRTAGVRGALDGAELQGVEAAVREANSLIDQRTFSWTDLFNRPGDDLAGKRDDDLGSTGDRGRGRLGGYGGSSAGEWKTSINSWSSWKRPGRLPTCWRGRRRPSRTACTVRRCAVDILAGTRRRARVDAPPGPES